MKPVSQKSQAGCCECLHPGLNRLFHYHPNHIQPPNTLEPLKMVLLGSILQSPQDPCFLPLIASILLVEDSMRHFL